MKAETGQGILPQTPFFMISQGLCSAAPHFPRVWLGGGRDRLGRGQEQPFLFLP